MNDETRLRNGKSVPKIESSFVFNVVNDKKGVKTATTFEFENKPLLNEIKGQVEKKYKIKTPFTLAYKKSGVYIPLTDNALERQNDEEFNGFKDYLYLIPFQTMKTFNHEKKGHIYRAIPYYVHRETGVGIIFELLEEYFDLEHMKEQINKEFDLKDEFRIFYKKDDIEFELTDNSIVRYREDEFLSTRDVLYIKTKVRKEKNEENKI